MTETPDEGALIHDGHPYAPGIDEDQPEWVDPRWCNTCGAQVRVPLARAVRAVLDPT